MRPAIETAWPLWALLQAWLRAAPAVPLPPRVVPAPALVVGVAYAWATEIRK